ncbi:unnamed protein product [Paramecium octaurelia]|uniref:Uncharacterized protein n=1 Tax=Paramecium octaurelia TaxID=43137 RepID=A0A8S1YN15_PAROT|nr:unnamed protein product [Paramecium octaurelia]
MQNQIIINNFVQKNICYALLSSFYYIFIQKLTNSLFQRRMPSKSPLDHRQDLLRILK